MKFLFRLLLIAFGVYYLSIIAPWWIVFVVTFSVGFILHGSPLILFIAGFLGSGTVWLGVAWYLDFKSLGFFSAKIIELFPIDDPIFLTIGAGLIGGLCGGFGALTGDSFKKLFVKKKMKSAYN
jgi:hypothetical protein